MTAGSCNAPLRLISPWWVLRCCPFASGSRGAWLQMFQQLDMFASSWCAAVVRPARSVVVEPFLCLFSSFLLLLFEYLYAAEEHSCLLLPAGLELFL